MKKGFALQSLMCLLAVSCSVQEMETMTPPSPVEGDEFYASLESYSASDTKVYVDKDNQSMVFWDEKDQISIFNKSTLNQKYEFLGNTGDNSGYFKKVSTETGGNPVNYVCAVYPYKKATSLDDSGVLTLKLPDKQTYREESFGLEANAMVSTTDGKENLLRFKNVGGYLVFKFFGQGPDGANISISSIKLEGRNGEHLSGAATMTPVIGELPVIEMAPTAGTSITLKCDKAVKLGKTENKATKFWVVVPPTTFSQGLKVTVTDKDGKVFVRESDVVLSIERNRVSTLSAIEVTPDVFLDPDRVIYYSTSDNVAITPNENADFGSSFVDSYYSEANKLCVMVFDGDVTEIGNHAFENCETLTDIMIPETVETIGDYAFAGCTNLGGYIPPSSATSKAPAKAPSRSGETTIVIPEGVTSIGAFAFKDCENLTSISIPETVTSIGDGAFKGCANLSDIDIPDSVTDLGENVFNGCTGITSVTIPDGVTQIDDYAFNGCDHLVSVSIPSSVTSIGQYAFNDCESLVNITLPDGLTSIKAHAFAGCIDLPGITIPNGVTYLGSSAFDSCLSITSITLPSSVSHIGHYAFADCPLTFIAVHAITPPLEVYEESFDSTNDCPIYVPSGSIDAYKTASGWSGYASRICDHVYVEMGNGMKWATTNVGAIGPDDLGDYFAWGRTEPLVSPDASYSNNNPFIDTATAIWGGDWRMPTLQEWETLKNEENYTWTWEPAKKGYTVESKVPGYVGNRIFLPAAGVIAEPGLLYLGSEGDYWANSLRTEGSGWSLFFDSSGVSTGDYGCGAGLSVRPVCD